MKPILIVENNTTPLTENVVGSGSKKDYILGGVFTEFGIKNRNERIYTAEKFIPCLEELNQRIQDMGVVYGEFDHPDVFDTSLSRASHIIKKASYVKESNRVDGQIKLLNTYWGREAKSLVDDGCPVFVSSRAAGVTENDGTVSLKKLFTYDIVADPGFASARMHSINESLGFKSTPQTNFRIYEMSDESKINDLFNMNKNEFVTKQQLTDYSKYLIKEIASTKKGVNSALKTGNINPKKLEQLLEYYEDLNKTNTQIVKYLDYLADKVQIVVNENKSLRTTADKLISHNDYLAENLEKAINYGEYLAENLDKNISYSEYLAENLDKNISYSEYLAENLDKNIAYSEYIAENLDKGISYTEYLAENLDNSIAYSEYLAEHVEGNIAYSEYIAEHLDDNIAYSEYIAENLDKTVSYAGMIAEKLNSGSLNESKKSSKKVVPTLEEMGFEENPMEEQDMMSYEEEMMGKEEEELPHLVASEEEIKSQAWSNEEEDTYSFESGEEEEGSNEEESYEEEKFEKNSDTELSKQIDKLIQEAKKRKVSETSEMHFLKFLNKRQADSFYNLTLEEQEQVKLYMNEKSYFSQGEVLNYIQEALSTQNESLEERLIRLMPENIKPIWSQLNESSKKSIMSQARLYPDLTTESNIEHFWMTRSLKKKESGTKKLVSVDPIIQEDRLNDTEMKSILERFKSL